MAEELSEKENSSFTTEETMPCRYLQNTSHRTRIIAFHSSIPGDCDLGNFPITTVCIKETILTLTIFGWNKAVGDSFSINCGQIGRCQR